MLNMDSTKKILGSILSRVESAAGSLTTTSTLPEVRYLEKEDGTTVLQCIVKVTQGNNGWVPEWVDVPTVKEIKPKTS